MWRWVTGPESFMDNGVGLAWDKGTLGNSNWGGTGRNGTNEGVEFGTEIDATAAQIGEVFTDDGSPFQDWASNHPNEPNNSGTEWLAHTVGTGNCDARGSVTDKAGCKADYELHWNDLPEIDWNGTETFAPKGIVVEYGGLENESDPRLRFSTQRVIKLQARQLNQATITISSGAQSGDAIIFGQEELTEAGITANPAMPGGGQTVKLTGEASCQEYLGLLQSAAFTHNGTNAGERTIKVSLGNVTKPTNAEHYYQVVEDLSLIHI